MSNSVNNKVNSNTEDVRNELARLERQVRQARGNRGPLGCLVRQFSLFLITIAIFVGAGLACAFFLPTTFAGLIKVVQSAGLNVYVTVLGSRGQDALKVTTYEADVTATASVERNLGVLSLIYGEGAKVTGTVRVALGADLKTNQYGILSCDVDTSTIRTTVGRAPLAGSAFDSEKIEQEAYAAFKAEASKVAISQYWKDARKRLEGEFTTWGLGLEIPAQPTLTSCPVISPAK
jgi:hypothetical protein